MQTVRILDNTTDNANVVGPTWNLPDTARGRFTAQVATSHLCGRFILEGSVVTEPTETDWFVLWEETFPRNPLDEHETASLGRSFHCNVAALRARLDRTAILPPPPITIELKHYGFIDRVLLRYS